MGFGQNLDRELGFVATINNSLSNIHYCVEIYIKNIKFICFEAVGSLSVVKMQMKLSSCSRYAAGNIREYLEC